MAGSSETLVPTYQTTRCHIPEGSNYFRFPTINLTFIYLLIYLCVYLQI
jgi:hypothetical protein